MNAKPFILLVEDNDDDIMLTRRALGKIDRSIDLVVAKDGEEGLNACRLAGKIAGDKGRRLPLFILLDLKLPKANGLEVFRCFKSEPLIKSIPIILISSSKEEVKLLEQEGLGADAYLYKPITADELAGYLEAYRALGEGRSPGEGSAHLQL